MEAQYDQDTLHKFELINKKVEEINQRRIGIRSTKVEDDLDRAELSAYIGSLNLTDEQRQIMDNINKSYERSTMGKGLIRFVVLAISVAIEAYLGFLIYEQLMMPAMQLFDVLYLVLLVGIFLFNLYQSMRLIGLFR
jgi:uncharacterized membrane protein